MWALTAKESFTNKQKKQKGNPEVFTGIPSQGEGQFGAKFEAACWIFKQAGTWAGISTQV